MNKKMSSFVGTITVAISMALLPATAIKANSPESLAYIDNSIDTNNPIQESVDSNYCVRVYGGWWCW